LLPARCKRRFQVVLAIQSDPVPLRIHTGGTAYVGETRVMLELVIQAYLNGASAEEIAESYDTLDLGDVYAVLGYYLHHRDEVHKYMKEQERRGEETRVRIEAWQESMGFDRAGLRQRLLARLEEKRQSEQP
jgi:uncharacterized protein (DUF433 family)